MARAAVTLMGRVLAFEVDIWVRWITRLQHWVFTAAADLNNLGTCLEGVQEG